MANVLQWDQSTNSFSVSGATSVTPVVGEGIDNNFSVAQTFGAGILQTSAAGTGNQSPLLNVGDAFSDFVADGMQWAIPSSASLTTTMSSGSAYLNSVRTLVPAVSGNNFPASNDTYVSVNNSGLIDYQSVANGATAPTPTSEYVQTAKIVTSPIQSPTSTLSTSTSGSLASGTYGIALVAFDATGYGAVGASGTVAVTSAQSGSGSIEISWVNPLNETSMDIYATTAGSTTLGLVASGVTGTTYTYTGSVAPGVAPPTTATSNAVQRILNVLDAGSPGKFLAKNITHLKYFGAAEDGITNDTEPLNNALNYLISVGGGTLFFNGNVSTDNFTIPTCITLSGTRAGPFSTINYQNVKTYPVLMCRNPSSSTPFVTLASADCHIENCAIYYPTQVDPATASTPVNYDYAIYSPTSNNGGNMVRCVTIINAFSGIYGNFARGGIKSCLIGAFNVGVFIDAQADYGYIEDTYVDLMYDVYEILQPTQQPLDTYTQNNLGAFKIGRADGIQIINSGVFWCGAGLALITSAVSGISPNNGYGQITNFSIDTSLYGINAASANAQGGGYVFTNLNVSAENDCIYFNGAMVSFTDAVVRVQSGNAFAYGSSPGQYSFRGKILSGASNVEEQSFSNYAYNNTSVDGTTSGIIDVYMPMQTSGGKQVILTFNAYENDTTTAQTINFPTAFSVTPLILGNSTGLTLTASTTGVTITAPGNTTTYSGTAVIMGN